MSHNLEAALKAAEKVEDWESKSKEIFKEMYPEDYRRLTAVGSESEYTAAKKSFQLRALHDINKYTQPQGLRVSLSSKDDAIAVPSLLLKTDEWNSLKDANGATIKHICEQLIGTLNLISRFKEDHDITVQLWIGGLVSFMESAITICVTGLKAGAETIQAALLAVAASNTAMIAVSVAVIALIVIPFLYFMFKPANCIILVSNNTDENLLYQDSHFAHGKFSFFTEKISKRVILGEASIVAGFFGAEKCSCALVGSRCGFTLKGENSNTLFSFGAVNPLTGSNGCWCGIGKSAKIAADSVEESCLDMTDSGNTCTIQIRAHSGSGSIAYFHLLISKK